MHTRRHRLTMGVLLLSPFLLAFGTVAGTQAVAQSNRDGASAHDVFFRARSRGIQELAAAQRARERSLDTRERTLEEREEDLREAELRLEARLEELQALRGEIEGQLGELDEDEEARVRALVRMVESMRAKEAAPMVAALDHDLAVRVLGRMNRTKAGKVLAAMNPTTAARFAEGVAATAQVGT